MDYKKIYINGEWVNPDTKEFIEVENPANKEILASIPRGNKNDVDKAVESAKKAFETWGYTELEERIRLMKNFVTELNKKADLMASIIYKELGCGQKFAKETHVMSYIKDVENFIRVIEEYSFEEEYDGFIVKKEPVGVVGALTPWNYPLGQITKKIVPALLTGNTVVLKPSQGTPLVAYHITQAIHDAGFPKGVFNMVTGAGKEVGNIISNHKDVDLISFTGSTDGGIEVAQEALKTVKKVALELGGKSPSIILKGADLNLALDASLSSIYLNTGQSCSALSRLIAPKEIKEELENMIIEKTKQFKFGDPEDKETVIGPLGSKRQFGKVKYYIEKGLEEGAKLIVGSVLKDDEKGYYVGPTVFTDVRNDMTIAQDEIFGPVLSIIYYDSLEEAIEIANDIQFGLYGAVFGPEEKAREVADRIRTGTVIINDGKRTHSAPFGGYKLSGIGREGGIWGIEEYLETKTIFKNTNL